MPDKTKNIYDDDNIPEIDLPRDEVKDSDSKDVKSSSEISTSTKNSARRE